jgi:Tfp pilus assembly protein PilP
VIRILILLLLLSGCAKDYDLNPWTTFLKHTLKGNHDKNKQEVLLPDIDSKNN